MFSFKEPEYKILEKDVAKSDIISKYKDNYLIVKNAHNVNGRIYGDVLAILTREEFEELDLGECEAPKFYIWEGIIIRNEVNENRLGIYT